MAQKANKKLPSKVSSTEVVEAGALPPDFLGEELSTCPAFLDQMFKQALSIGSKGQEIDEKGVAFVIAAVRGIGPRDEAEAMLAMQMTATHNLIMTFARRLMHTETIQQQDAAERAYNKLCRTYATQVEALKRYRSKGEHKMVVEHVTVNAGGQAIVGTVSSGRGGS